jgi:hypothetical protein
MENLLCSSGYGLKKEKFVLLLTIISDRFHWTACHCFFAQSLFFFRLRLLEHKRVVVFVGAHEIYWGCIATDVTIDTRRVDVVCAGNIFFYAIVSIRHEGFWIWDFGFGIGSFRELQTTLVRNQSAIANQKSQIVMGVSSLPA